MTMRSKGTVIVIGISAMLAVVGIWQVTRLNNELQTARHKQQTFRQLAESLREANENTTANLQRAEKQLADMRKNESELLRLRGENARLRNQAQNPAALQKNAPNPQPSNTTAIPPVETHSLSTSVRIPAGQTAITGGWKGADGKRSLTLITPVLQPEGQGARQIVVRSKIIEATDEAWQQLGLQNFPTDAGQETQSGLLTAEQAQILIASVTNTPGAEVLSSPQISTADGIGASLFVGSAPPPGDTNPAPGIKMDLVPAVAPGQDTVELKIDLQINRKTTAATAR